MIARDTTTVTDLVKAAKEDLERSASKLADHHRHPMQCEAHDVLQEGVRAIARGLSLLLSDKLSALETVNSAAAKQRERVLMWFSGACALGAVASALLHLLRGAPTP